MSKAGKRIVEGMKEAVAIAKGEQPAASITLEGFTYTYLPRGSRVVAAGKMDKETLEAVVDIVLGFQIMRALDADQQAVGYSDGQYTAYLEVINHLNELIEDDK